jgi:hypothetical protein
MLERDWVSIIDPDDAHQRYLFDLSFMLSSYQCIYGRGCPGTAEGWDPERGCCRVGAHYMDEDERVWVEGLVEELGPEWMQRYHEAKRDGVSAREADGDARTRVRGGACIFLNRGDFPTGAGCALHHYAVGNGFHHSDKKPEVCWIVPLRREVEESVADDGEAMWTTTITSYDRGAWGPGGAEFAWWCTEEPEAYTAPEPVYRSTETELRKMVGDAVYDELAAYCDDRRRHAKRPLPFPVFVRA